MLNSIDGVIGFGEINLVLISNDLSLRLSLETHLNNVSGFIIEKSVGVTQPGNYTEKNTKKRIGYKMKRERGYQSKFSILLHI